MVCREGVAGHHLHIYSQGQIAPGVEGLLPNQCSFLFVFPVSRTIYTDSLKNGKTNVEMRTKVKPHIEGEVGGVV